VSVIGNEPAADSKSPRIVLLGPQFHEPTVGAVVRDLGLKGRVATITAGWQEWEAEDAALVRDLSGAAVPLRLYERAERVWDADPELLAGHKAMQADLRALRGLYNQQLEPAAQAWVELIESDAPEHLLAPERAAALEAIQRLDDRLLSRTTETREAFYARLRPLERDAVAKERVQIASELATVSTVVIEGGHIAVLLNRLALFGVPDLLTGKTVIGCAGGAMALCRRVALYNDSPAIGRGHAEVCLSGLGLAPGILALPDASQRLRLDDAARMQRLALRVAPDVCALLDAGARVEWDGSTWTGVGSSRVLADGSLQAWGRAA
jgi:hypothetical protein